MYGTVPPKPKVRRQTDNESAVEMEPLMVDPYFDKNFAPEVFFFHENNIVTSTKKLIKESLPALPCSSFNSRAPSLPSSSLLWSRQSQWSSVTCWSCFANFTLFRFLTLSHRLIQSDRNRGVFPGPGRRTLASREVWPFLRQQAHQDDDARRLDTVRPRIFTNDWPLFTFENLLVFMHFLCVINCLLESLW